MRTIRLGTSDLEVPVIALGCMGFGRLTAEEAAKTVSNALEHGIDFFDHADIYGAGKAEEIFAEAVKLTGTPREKLIIQTKCGIRKGYFDFSKEHILASVDGSLKRLNTDYIDILLLHRPDALMEPEEVAEAFDRLRASGKVRRFGVSNHNPLQIELLKTAVKQDLIVNQLQLSVMHTGMIDAGLWVNNKHESAVVRDSGILDYSRLHHMTIQAWSPFRYGYFEGFFVDNEKFPELNAKLEEIGGRYGINKSAAAIAWILRHPAKIQTIVGTTNPDRLTAIAKAADVSLTREEWYEIYRAAGNTLP